MQTSGPTEPGLPEDPDALEKIIDARRRHLAETVDELAVRAQPKEIARRTATDAKERAVGLVSDDSGNLRYERVAAAAAAAGAPRRAGRRPSAGGPGVACGSDAPVSQQ